MSLLFEPYLTRSLRVRNRLVVSPMCEYSSQDGMANDWHLVHLGSRAVGGAGVVMTEACSVSPEGRISPGDLGLWKEAQIEPLARITRFVRRQGAVAGIQLAHAGRKASHQAPWEGGRQLELSEGGWETLAPSALPYHEQERPPLALDENGIKQVIEDFRAASCRALEAGFELVEIHAAHGYLLHEFLSPLSNQRTDAYGGSLENRCRLVLEVARSVRETWPEHLPIWVRISASDWAPGGWDLESSKYLARRLRELGTDLIDCSSGGLVPHQHIALEPGYQVPFSEAIRKDCAIATAAVGLITDARQAETILREGKADLICLARAMLRDPYFALHAAGELGAAIAWPNQYERARPKN